MDNRKHVGDLFKQKILNISETYHDVIEFYISKPWAVFKPKESNSLPEQGWKIHVSFIPSTSIEVLDKIAPILIDAQVTWKVVTDEEQLYYINNLAPITQTGKTLTIYPENNREFINIIKLLYKNTSTFYGPSVLTDKAYKDSKCLFYRYGSFKRTTRFDIFTGAKVQLIRNEISNGLEIESRKPGRYKPFWISDIFDNASKQTPNQFEGITFKRALKQGKKGGVYLTNYHNKICVLKESRKHVYVDKFGRDARDRLLNEYNALNTLSDLKFTPNPLKIFRASDNLYLLIDHIDGVTLRSFVESKLNKGVEDFFLLLNIAKKITCAIKSINEKGILFNDLSPNNILITNDNDVRIIDFEVSSKFNCEEPFEGSTPGYSNYLDSTSDTNPDHYALGAIFYFMSTGVDPFFKKKDKYDLFSSLNEYLRLTVYSPLIKLGLLGLDIMKADKTNYQNIINTLDKLMHNFTSGLNEITFENKNILNSSLVLQKTEEIAHFIYQKSNFSNTQTLWDQNSYSSKFHISNFNSGIAGIAYFYLEVFEITKDKTYLFYCKSILDWLFENHPFIREETPIFLYFGYGSIPLISVRLGTYLKDELYINKGLQLANVISLEKIYQYNISHGAAGLGLMYLEIYKITKDLQQLENAEKMFRLIHINQKKYKNLIYWESIDNDSGKILSYKSLGYSHGIAGIGNFLLALYQETKDPNSLTLIMEIINTLNSTRVNTFSLKGYSWSHHLDNTTPKALWMHWCNGVSGISEFLLNAYKILNDDTSIKLLKKSLYSLSSNMTFSSFTQCHGLSGNGEILNYASEILEDPILKNVALNNAHRLFSLKYDSDDLWFWTTEDKTTISPEYMTGYLGVYSFYLRMFFDLPLPLRGLINK